MALCSRLFSPSPIPITGPSNSAASSNAAKPTAGNGGIASGARALFKSPVFWAMTLAVIVLAAIPLASAFSSSSQGDSSADNNPLAIKDNEKQINLVFDTIGQMKNAMDNLVNALYSLAPQIRIGRDASLDSCQLAAVYKNIDSDMRRVTLISHMGESDIPFALPPSVRDDLLKALKNAIQPWNSTVSELSMHYDEVKATMAESQRQCWQACAASRMADENLLATLMRGVNTLIQTIMNQLGMYYSDVAAEKDEQCMRERINTANTDILLAGMRKAASGLYSACHAFYHSLKPLHGH